MHQKLGIVVGPLFLLVGVLLGFSHLSELVSYSGAPRVEATVLVADYAHVARGNGARTITLAAPDPVPLDDLDTAPGNLAPGDTVTALLHDGHALLPSQVGWSTLLVPIAAAVVGLALTAVGVAAIRADPPPRPTDPEAWD